jgi:predicted deacylase
MHYGLACSLLKETDKSIFHSMLDFQIHNTRIRPGQHVKIDIPIARLPSHTLIDLQVFVYRAKEEGPSLLLSAGVHGDEINGIDIVKRLIMDRSLIPDRGTVVAIPLVNVYGFIANSRTFPDGRDLNRSFPGRAAGSLAAQVAYIVMREILPCIDFGVDFHTGGAKITNIPQVRLDFQDEKSIELAKAFGARFVLNSGLIEKSFRKEAFKKGKSLLVYEAGESLRIDENSIREGMDGVLNLMKYFKMKKGKHEHREQIIIRESSWVRARVSGIFNSVVNQGDYVRKGQVLARITDPYGMVKVPVKSPASGYVIGLNNMPVVHNGDALMHIGRL